MAGVYCVMFRMFQLNMVPPALNTSQGFTAIFARVGHPSVDPLNMSVDLRFVLATVITLWTMVYDPQVLLLLVSSQV